MHMDNEVQYVTWNGDYRGTGGSLLSGNVMFLREKLDFASHFYMYVGWPPFSVELSVLAVWLHARYHVTKHATSEEHHVINSRIKGSPAPRADARCGATACPVLGARHTLSRVRGASAQAVPKPEGRPGRNRGFALHRRGRNAR
ncbi:hypothetical protein XAUC_31700 [Xanthomonas citri pv. aurantifolii str. ICPB 10535]|nr:hypothetical protein XAUC_31700 [Xanthomonas citri pv. aurantifolii str. ICPB 10535]